MSEVTRNRKFHHLQNYTLKLRYLIGLNHDAISKIQSLYKIHLNTISNGELSDPLCHSVNKMSDPLCHSVNRGMTLVILAV